MLAIVRRSIGSAFEAWKPRRAAAGVESVTKKEIVKTISDKIGMTQLKTKEIVQNTFQAIVDTLVEERRIELRSLRRVRSCNSGPPGSCGIPARDKGSACRRSPVATFKPGKQMEERVRQLEEAEEARLAKMAQEMVDLADPRRKVGHGRRNGSPRKVRTNPKSPTHPS
jgi:nucleoid DNA-binding protein